MPVAVLLAILAAATAATSASAAKAHTIQTSWLCNPFSTSLTPTSRLLTSGTARGDVAREPGLASTIEEVPAYAQNHGPAFSATVDVYVHSVTDGSIGAVSDADIAAQIRVLNNGYSGQEGGYPTGFTFVLAGVDRTDNAEWFYAGPTTSGEREMKQTLHQGDASDLNIYLTTAGAYLGWAYLPSTYKTKPWIDGIVIDWASMVRTSTQYKGQYDLGKTATHETGHWLGLEHVFYGGCNAKGDFVDDTPPQLIATHGCPEGQDSCKEPGLDSIHNYMDYSFDACYNQFTAGQTARMQDQWNYFRADGGFTVQ